MGSKKEVIKKAVPGVVIQCPYCGKLVQLDTKAKVRYSETVVEKKEEIPWEPRRSVMTSMKEEEEKRLKET